MFKGYAHVDYTPFTMIQTTVPGRTRSALFRGFLTALALILASSAVAQVVSSGLSGLIRDAKSAPITEAVVTATHVPTGSVYTATSGSTGRYNFRGLIPGGPYTVVVKKDGFTPTQRTDVTTSLGADLDLGFTLTASDVVAMEAFTVKEDANDLDGGAIGAGSVLTAERLAAKPTSERSLADMVSATPLITLRSTFGDREESQITAVGQNNRYNSVLIDGARINDQFGLNGTGLASFFNPLSLDTIEQIATDVSPYDVKLASFTGAAINAVTKSGTNRFKGSLYYYFRGDELAGVQLQGENERERFLNGANKIVPPLERTTMGATFGGPIIKNRLFFFLNYEELESAGAGRDPRFSTPNESAILTRLGQISSAAGKTIAWGNPVTSRTSNVSEEKKILAKIDWAINSDHRLSVRYSTTEGEVPQFGNFAGATSNNAGVTGGINTSSDGHFYSQTREEKSIAAQLLSQWTPDFKTEVKYSNTKQDQATPVNSTAPMTYIFGLTGTDLLNGATVTNGAYIAGTEQFRQGNAIAVDTDQFSASGDYFWRNFVFSGGVEREQNDFYNLFRQGSYGLVSYRTYADFLADTNAVIQRNYYDPAKRPVADVSDFTTTGIYAQAKWDVSPRLTVNAGLRYEFGETDLKPELNRDFLTATGFRNDGTLDGSSAISPRVGFNFAVDDKRTIQIRGGVGHFLGRAPWVFFSNSFGATGVGTFSRSSADAINPLPTSLTTFLRTDFDPANPIATGTDNPNLRREVDWSDGDIELPQVWRGNLAVDFKLPVLDSTLTFEMVHSSVDQALFIVNENLRPSTLPSADGRQRFSGNPGTAANARFAGYTDLFRVKNVDVGESTYYTATWDRPFKNKWAANVSYSRGSSVEAQAIGQTTASGQWQRNVVFNQSAVENGVSDFEVRDRLQVSYSRQIEVYKNWKTIVSVYYEGRTGNPFSWVYGSVGAASGDLNGDGRTDNDLVAVPSGVDDARFDFSGMTTAQRDAMLAFIQSSGLGRYAGGVAPKNGFTEPWFNRLDLKFVQQIPVYSSVKLSLFFDFINFGSFIDDELFSYTEVAPGISNDVFRRRFLSAASYGTDGRIRPTYTATPGDFGIDNGMSRWRIQLGARIEF